MSKNQLNGFAIAIAWPETYCKQPGAWYDGLNNTLGIARNNYYKAGHAAVILIDNNERVCHYFDFGRYHTPFMHGRVRNKDTDHELTIRTKPVLKDNQECIVNLEEIANELQLNEACHGDGRFYGAYCKINFQKAYIKAMELQERSPIPYGPFTINGSNCSRFVQSVILAGEPAKKVQRSLKLKIPLTPTPISNVNALGHRIQINQIRTNEPFCPSEKLDDKRLGSTLTEPQKVGPIPHDAKWLSGEGAGSWYHIEEGEAGYFITRYCPRGSIECEGLFMIKGALPFDMANEYSISYLSHCRNVLIKQAGKLIEFERI